MKAKLKLILITSVIVSLLLGGAGWIFYKQTIAKEKPKELTADDIVATLVEIDQITTNLKSGGFVQLRFKIQTSSDEAKEELEKRDFQIRNITLRLISSMTEEQITSPDGMASFEKEMKTQLNNLMQNGSIVQIYTTNKIIQ